MGLARRIQRFLIHLSGEDLNIIADSPTRIQRWFAGIGSLVLIIFAGCFLSATSFFYSLFEGKWWVSFFIGVTWALIVTNIYLLLLYTITPTILPTAKKKKKRVISVATLPQQSFLTPSMISRIGFMLILAVIISQPLNVLILSSQVEGRLADARDAYRIRMLLISDSAIVRRELAQQKHFAIEAMSRLSHHERRQIVENVKIFDEKVADDQRFLEVAETLLSLLKNTRTSAQKDSLRWLLNQEIASALASDQAFLQRISELRFQNEKIGDALDRYRLSMAQLITFKIRNYESFDTLLKKSNFYIRRIQLILEDTIWGWLITIVVCIIFVLPIYLKFQVRNRTDYYERRRKKEERFVRVQYELFKTQYTAVFDRKLHEFAKHTRVRLAPYLENLCRFNYDRANQFRMEIEREIVPIPIHKYEYWADPPFRHLHRRLQRATRTEQELLEKLYREHFGSNGFPQLNHGED